MQSNSTMKTHSSRKGCAAGCTALAVAVAAAYASPSGATENVPYSPPDAHVQVWDCGDCVGFVPFVFDFDGAILGGLGDPLSPRIAIAGEGAASAKAESSTNAFTVKAIVAPTKHGQAAAHAHWLFIPHDDSQTRSQVRLDLKLKMSATQASVDGTSEQYSGAASGAGYGILVCAIGTQPGYLTYDASGSLTNIGEPECGLDYYNFHAFTIGAGGGYWERELRKFGTRSWFLTGKGMDVSDVIDVGVDVIPGLPYMLTIYATANTSYNGGKDRGAAIAAVDPVLEPDSVNPDVWIEFPNLAVDPNPQPLLGDLTPEALTAMGLNPQPFVDLGFFDPPSGVPPSDPPPPPPMPKYWCSPGFWLNNAVSFGASAWPVSQPTYYDYNSTAGQLAGCPTASGNATLLQVLQNPSSYFSTQLRGAGFNCVGDYLSAKSGLVGTKADNNGVCSIDQFGRQIQ